MYIFQYVYIMCRVLLFSKLLY